MMQISSNPLVKLTELWTTGNRFILKLVDFHFFVFMFTKFMNVIWNKILEMGLLK